jgi:hypothetical protein
MDAVRDQDDVGAFLGLHDRHDSTRVRPQLAQGVYASVPDREHWIDQGSQDAWTRVWSRRATWNRSRGLFTGWLHQITHSVLIENLRRIQRLSQVQVESAGPDPEVLPLSHLMIDLAEVMIAVLRSYEERDRLHISLRYFLLSGTAGTPETSGTADTDTELETALAAPAGTGFRPSLELAEVMCRGLEQPPRTFREAREAYTTRMGQNALTFGPFSQLCLRFRVDVEREWNA